MFRFFYENSLECRCMPPQWPKVKRKAINMDLSPCLQAFQLNSIKKSTYILFAQNSKKIKGIKLCSWNDRKAATTKTQPNSFEITGLAL